MKKEDIANRSEIQTQRCKSASNYGCKKKRIKVPSYPEVTLVGLMLLVTLPIGASVKQSVPRVKISHRGKILTTSSTLLFILILFTLRCWNKTYSKWKYVGQL
ncbi:unnamed protein product [Tetraodon nigroviridis]|uniref:(spotted green pufferfish) hypothetical protein n=1 Tax=Tetraodon nigroviridis TaxID=99883 RepID=Q4REZ8_TETNG|nr:unnamed protein product [Tetraodon nigroviridis]